MKAQILVNFVVECSIFDKEPISESPNDIEEDSCWMLHVDGTSNSKGSRVGLILPSLEGDITEQALRFNFDNSNNDVEYEACRIFSNSHIWPRRIFSNSTKKILLMFLKGLVLKLC